MEIKPLFAEESGGADGSTGAGGAAATTLLDAPAASTNTAPPSWVGDGGIFNHDALPRDLQGYEALKTLKDVPSLAKAFGETKKLIGSKLSPPAADANEAQITEWKKTIGAPLTVDQYEMVKDGLPESAKLDEGLHKAIAAVAHKHHIPAAAWKDLLSTYNKHTVGNMEVSAAQQQADDAAFVTEQVTALKEAWGNDFDKNKMAAAKVAAIAGLPIDHPALQFADVVKGLATLAGAFSETAAASLVPAGGNLGGGKSQAHSVINDKANPLNQAYWDVSHPNHNSTVAMVQNLMKKG